MTDKTNDGNLETRENEFRKKFAENLRAIRKAQGLTQSELGALCGRDGRTAERMIQKWEHRDTLPNAYNIRLLANALKVTADELLPK